MLAVKLSSHLKKLVKKCPAIHRQFVPSKFEILEGDELTDDDPLLEDDHIAVRGLIHKYKNRALILLTMNCSAYCRFCTRRRRVSDIEKGVLTKKDIANMFLYVKKHPEIKELIFSGGDALMIPDLLKTVLKKFSVIPHIKIIRVGTRLPVSEPKLVNDKVLSALKSVKNKPLYLMVHFEHPEEINKLTVAAIKKLQNVSTMVLSQSVFLKGVNDDVDVLENLFSKLVEIGVKPYYLFRCDPVRGAEHFIVDAKKEIKIMTELRKRLSGLACPLYVIDVPRGFGKVPVPLNFWNFNAANYKDFNWQEKFHTD